MYIGGTHFSDLYRPAHSLILEVSTHVRYSRLILVYGMLTHRSAIGIIGATVMPHSIFLGSALATQDRVNVSKPEKQLPTQMPGKTKTSSEFSESVKLPSRLRKTYQDARASFFSHFRITPVEAFADEPKSHQDRENRPYTIVAAHIYHGMVDIVISLLGFAVIINAM